MASSQAAPLPAPHLSYAGFLPRLGAHLLDLAVGYSVVVLVGITVRGLRAAGLWTPDVQGIGVQDLLRRIGFVAKLSIIFAFALSQGLIYKVLFEASGWQATFGKRLLNVYVTDNTGGRISILTSFWRWLAKWFFGLFGGSFASAITIAATENRKALHDYAARTLVKRGRPGGTLEPWRVATAFVFQFVWTMATFLVIFSSL